MGIQNLWNLIKEPMFLQFIALAIMCLIMRVTLKLKDSDDEHTN